MTQNLGGGAVNAQGSATKTKTRGRYVRVFVGLRTSKKWRAIDAKGGPTFEHFGLLVCLSLHSRLFETDGLLSKSDIRRAADLGEHGPAKNLDDLLDDLTTCGFVERIAGGGIRIHEWESHQVSEAKLRAAQLNGRKGGRPKNPNGLSVGFGLGFPSVSENDIREGGDSASRDVGKRARHAATPPGSNGSNVKAADFGIEEENQRSVILGSRLGSAQRVEPKGMSIASASAEAASKPPELWPVRGATLAGEPLEAFRRVRDLFLALWSKRTLKDAKAHRWAQGDNSALREHLGFYVRLEGSIAAGEAKMTALIQLAFKFEQPEWRFRGGGTPTFKELAAQLVWLDSWSGAASSQGATKSGTAALQARVREARREQDNNGGRA